MKSCIDNIRVGDTLLVWCNRKHETRYPGRSDAAMEERFEVLSFLEEPRESWFKVAAHDEYGGYIFIHPKKVVGVVKKL